MTYTLMYSAITVEHVIPKSRPMVGGQFWDDLIAKQGKVPCVVVIGERYYGWHDCG